MLHRVHHQWKASVNRVCRTTLFVYRSLPSRHKSRHPFGNVSKVSHSSHTLLLPGIRPSFISIPQQSRTLYHSQQFFLCTVRQRILIPSCIQHWLLISTPWFVHSNRCFRFHYTTANLHDNRSNTVSGLRNTRLDFKCQQAIQDLDTCHKTHTFSKFLGACNKAKAALDKCLSDEYLVNRELNAEKARMSKQRLKTLIEHDKQP